MGAEMSWGQSAQRPWSLSRSVVVSAGGRDPAPGWQTFSRNWG